MVEADTELVTYDRGPLAARMGARALASAEGQFDLRRGVRAEAKAEISTSLDATLGATPGFTASLHAQLAAAGRAAFAAQLDVYGLFAEVALVAEARARIRGDIGLDGAALMAAMAVQLPPALFRPASVILRKAEIHAGVSAEAYFAVKAQARLMAAGSVLPTSRNNHRSGYAVEFQYGYAWVFGAGVVGNVDIEFPDAGDVLDALVREVLAQVAELIPAHQRTITTLLDIVLPLAASAAVALGAQLGVPKDTTDAAAAGDELDGLIPAFLAQLRGSGLDLVMSTVVTAALGQAATAILAAVDRPLSPAAHATASRVLGEARTILAGFTGAAVPLDVLPVFIDLCGSLGELSDGSAGDPLTPVLDAVTLAAAGAAILLSVLGGGPVGDFPAPLSRHVHRLLRQVPADDTAPAPAELVEYITAGLGGLDAEVRGRLGVLAAALSTDTEALVGWLWDIGAATQDADAARRLAQDVLAGLVAALDAQVGPWVDSLPPGELRDVATFIRPLLEVAALALPALVAGDLTAADAQRLRDQLDVLLTQLFGPLVIRVSDSVLRPYFRQGAVQLRALADAVDRADPAYADFFAVANRFGLIFRINETIVSAALRETAEIVSIVESVGFDSALKLMNAFVLLPEPALERRAELARLVGGDAARVGDAELRAGLLEAMFVDSHELALRMIPPSLRMSALIAAEQGPLPLVTLFNDAKAVGAAMARTADDLEQAGTDAVNLIADLLERGRVSAEELLAFGEDLKALVHDLADVVHSVLGVVKDLLWPVWVVSTGGWGLAFPELYDQFFDGADWIVDLIQGALDDVADALVTSAIVVAQDLGILDTGSGGDLGQLGQFVRQRALGDPDQAGVTIQLGPGSATMSHAELSTEVANAALGRADVQDTIRQIHYRAVEQAALSKRVAALQSGSAAIRQQVTDLRRSLAARQRPTGAPLRVTIDGVADGDVIATGHTVDIVLTGANREFVTNASTQVRLEVGGWPIHLDERIWTLEGQNRLRFRLRIVVDASQPSPHPLIVAGALRLTRQHILALPRPDPPRLESLPGDVVGPSLLPLLTRRAQQQVHIVAPAVSTAESDPIERLLAEAPGAPASFVAADFLPAQMRSSPSFVTAADMSVVTASRGALLERAGTGPRRAAVDRLPGWGDTVVLPISELSGLTAQALPPPADLSCAMIVSNRPGFLTITAAVCAVPMAGQDERTTPQHVQSIWCVLAPDAP